MIAPDTISHLRIQPPAAELPLFRRQRLTEFTVGWKHAGTETRQWDSLLGQRVAGSKPTRNRGGGPSVAPRAGDRSGLSAFSRRFGSRRRDRVVAHFDQRRRG